MITGPRPEYIRPGRWYRAAYSIPVKVGAYGERCESYSLLLIFKVARLLNYDVMDSLWQARAPRGSEAAVFIQKLLP
jgi:hypothetical protein